jgi:hypothetical protein
MAKPVKRFFDGKKDSACCLLLIKGTGRPLCKAKEFLGRGVSLSKSKLDLRQGVACVNKFF